MKRYIRSSQSFEDLNIRTYRFNTHLAPSPFKTCTGEEGQEVRQQLNQSNDTGVTKRCDMSTLVTDQPVNQVSVLREMWESAPSVDALEQIGNHLPLVVHYNGKDYLLDGNTRATLMSAMGADTLLCTYVNLDSITASYSVWDSAKPMQFPFRVQVHYEGNIYDENGNKETTFEATTMAISLTQARSRILNQYWKRVGDTRKRWSIDENKLEIQLTPKEQELWDKYYATPEIPTCPRCGRRLTDGKYCPVCDDGEQDYE